MFKTTPNVRVRFCTSSFVVLSSFTRFSQLDGHTALAVVRARHLQYFANGRWNNEPLSDLARIRRDQTFLRVFVAAARAQMSNPLKANALLGALLSQVTVDSG